MVHRVISLRWKLLQTRHIALMACLGEVLPSSARDMVR
jgi:hypothetical protein